MRQHSAGKCSWDVPDRSPHPHHGEQQQRECLHPDRRHRHPGPPQRENVLRVHWEDDPHQPHNGYQGGGEHGGKDVRIIEEGEEAAAGGAKEGAALGEPGRERESSCCRYCLSKCLFIPCGYYWQVYC